MSNITVELYTDDEAMQDPKQIAKALRELADEFVNDTTGLDDYFTMKNIFNDDGKVIGQVVVNYE